MSFTSSGKNIISSVLNFFTNSSSDTNSDMSSNKDHSAFRPEVNISDQSTIEGGEGWKIGNILEKRHKKTPEEELWFSGVGEKNSYLPRNMENYPIHWHSNTHSSSQLALNISKNCYEMLPISQTSNFSYFHQFPPLHQELTGYQVDVSDYQEHFVTNIIDIVEDSLVEIVCNRSSNPSPHRLAAQTLANSNLNPNAKEFTPKEVIESVIVDPTDSVDEDKIDECIPDDSIEFRDDLTFKHSDNIQRPKDSIDEDVPSSSNTCAFLIIPGAHEEDSSDDDDDNEDDSDWWDSDEEANGQCIEIDPSEFQDLMPCPFYVSSLPCKKSSTLSSSDCISTTEVNTSLETCVDEIEKSSDERINKINELYFCDNDDLCATAKKCKVQFCDNLNVVIEEPDDISEDLAIARVSDFKERQADKERMERLLRPVFSPLHREKMFKKIYCDNSARI